ncbi:MULTISPECIES: trypsin-like serine protease [Shewanella]|uniref:Peptidase S1 n=1 Tax=Shewanella japonica TaxID=93973 RepID=A0ABM6JL25_9GAMM|nr:trypsin-like serine protease [Shewanella japonica]ARD22966.1 peptidase S1 [Shewanella japonica]
MRIILVSTLIFISLSASAIVVRHDIDNEKYLAYSEDFKPLATFYVDGAHGVLIKPKWVVTAAHATFCVNSGSYIALHNGLHKVERIFVHKNYQPGKSHDIALVKLVNPINDIEPATIYEKSDELGKSTWFIGVGGTGNGLTGQTIDNYENAGVLRKAENKIVLANGPLIKFRFDRDSSALPLEGVSGGGDSGGPAYIKTNNTNYLLGISSRVEGGSIGKYGVTEVYSRVSFFNSWIESITSEDELYQLQFATPKLDALPTGLSKEILPEVCSDIGLRPNAI